MMTGDSLYWAMFGDSVVCRLLVTVGDVAAVTTVTAYW